MVVGVADGHGELDRRLDALLARTVARTRGVHHGLLAVAATDGSWSWEGAHGEADPDGTPVTVGTRYPIASVTKLFTSVSTMLLVERGTLGLGDRLVALLPADVTRGLHVLDGVDRTAELTIEHLLRHASGLPDYYEEAPRGQRSPQARLLAGEDAPVPFDEVVRLVRDDLTPHFPPRPADSPHGRARYADTNFQLLGACLERAAGQPLRALFDELILAPLGLDDTASYPERPRSGAVAEPQARVWAGAVVLEPRGALTHQVADGGIVSTLADQVAFLRAVVTGQVFQDPGTWRRMHERTDRVFFPVDYGLGVMRYAPPRWMSPASAIPPLIGHTGSTASWSFHCEQLEIVVAGTFDVARPPLPFRFVPRVLRAVAGGSSSSR